MLIGTDAFIDAFKAMARLGGIPGMKWAMVPHPLCSLTEDVLMERAKSAAEQFITIVVRE